MSTRVRQALQGAAGAAGGGGLNVEDVFSTYLYTGNSSTQTITNGIDLAGEGGMVWFKSRTDTKNHAITDSERGVGNFVYPNTTGSQTGGAGVGVDFFSSDGFQLDSQAFINGNAVDFASWTFRKAPKFFDVVTYTGDGTASNIISHNLGSIPGFVVVKRTDSTGDWHIAARYSNGQYVHGNASFPTALNLTSAGNAITSTNGASDMSLTSTTFDAKKINGYNTHNGSGNLTNINGATYVAYLFAHNDGDGNFGSTGDQDIIKCGSFTTDASGVANVDLGFEPQWIITKKTNEVADWEIFDVMRGWVNNPSSSLDNLLRANTSGTEYTGIDGRGHPTATGFRWENTSNDFHIYIAIRRGPMAVPESATDVFDLVARTGTGSAVTVSSSLSYVDAAFLSARTGTIYPSLYDRLRSAKKMLITSMSLNELTDSETLTGFDLQEGIKLGPDSGGYGINVNSRTTINYMWRRAPNFFDVVCYNGNGTAGRTVSHNLGVAPEMMWIKKRNGDENWAVYHADQGNTKEARLNQSSAFGTSTTHWNSTSPTDTVFTLGASASVNSNSNTFVAYLFATLDGISKVGSYAGSNSAQTIDCGFSSGARFVLIKNASIANDWYVYDSARGIVAGNDPFLRINSSSAENTATDYIDPHNSGFTIDGNIETLNQSGSNYIFYAIA